MGASFAFVLPRYGKDLGGGAEALARGILLGLQSAYSKDLLPLAKLEVWTTCARDHRTWKNEHPCGVSEEDGMLVRRFPVDERDLEIFISSEMKMAQGWELSVDEQLAWLSESVNSKSLYEHIVSHGKDFDLLFFAPYLFATSFWGSLIYPERSVLIPCLHDEQYAYLDVFRCAFESVSGLVFNTNAERELARSLYKLKDLDKRSEVVGMGFDMPDTQAPGQEECASLLKQASLWQKLEPILHSPETPYLLYSGRKEQGKNLDMLIDYHEEFCRRESSPNCPLVIIGSGNIEFRKQLPERVIDLGFVTEEEKKLLMCSALCLCQPSKKESFSIVIMEAWREGTPVIVHGDCAVTREHVETSNGGLCFSNIDEYCEVMRCLLSEEELRKNLGLSGMAYVKRDYSWQAVLERFHRGCRKFEERSRKLRD